MEKIVETVRVTGHRCVGCQRHKRPVMITIQDAADRAGCKFVDIFLTFDQAKELGSRLIAATREAEGCEFPNE